MGTRDIIVVGASLGGMRALQRLCEGLPADLPAAIFIVWHTAPNAPGILPEVLNRVGPLPAAYAEEGEPIRNGHIYVAPPDRHLLVTSAGVHVSRGARENRFRPAVDTLFRSAASAYGSRVIGIVLTGLLDDGSQGLWFIKRRGGICIVQDPHGAEGPDMPQNAIDEGVVDHIATLAEMPALIAQLLHEPVKEPAKPHGDAAMLTRDDKDLAHLHPPIVPGPQVPLSCPECHGALWIGGDGAASVPMRYECHVGHQYSEQSLASAKQEELEMAMWTALRVLKENAALLGTMSERARAGGRLKSADGFDRTRQEYHDKAQLIRRAIEGAPPRHGEAV